MSPNPAPLILALIAAVAATVWLIAAYFLANSQAIAAKRDRSEPGKVDAGGEIAMAGATTIIGGAVIEGQPDPLSTRLAAALARNGLWPGAPLEITDRTPSIVSFVSPGEPNKPRGEIQLASSGLDRTRIDYRVEFEALGRFLQWAWIIQAAGLILLAVAYWALRTYVATSTNLAVRWQSVQMIQIIHILWPPFLLGTLYRKQYQLVRRQLETIIKNLPHTQV